MRTLPEDSSGPGLEEIKKQPKNNALASAARFIGMLSHAQQGQIQLPARAHTQAVGSLPGQGACGRQRINVSLSH